MGANPSRSINTALDFLFQQIHATWQNIDSIATLLLLGIKGAFHGSHTSTATMQHEREKNSGVDSGVGQ